MAIRTAAASTLLGTRFIVRDSVALSAGRRQRWLASDHDRCLRARRRGADPGPPVAGRCCALDAGCRRLSSPPPPSTRRLSAHPQAGAWLEARMLVTEQMPAGPVHRGAGALPRRAPCAFAIRRWPHCA
ncbi:hypothetical protein ACU4GD_10750 [Cupriavidus basilensis]